MKFAVVADYFSQLSKTSSRNLITEILAELFKTVEPDEIGPVCYLALGGLRPKFDRLEMNMAEKMVIRGLAEAFKKEGKEVWQTYKQVGDLGMVAERLKLESKSRTDEDLSISEVYKALEDIALETGSGSQERKQTRLVELLHQLKPVSVKYVIRIMLGRLRLGFSDMTMLDALAVMDQGTKTGRVELEHSYQVFPDIGNLAVLIKRYGIKGLPEHVQVTMGVPVVSALCQRLKTADEMIQKMGRVIVEPKFDGTRIQIHMRKNPQSGWIVRTFTRNLDETTEMFPELMQILPKIKAKEVILDGEAVGVDLKTGRYLPFQETITRKRKHDIEATLRSVPLRFMVFDLLYKDGRSLIKEPLTKRRELLKQTIDSNLIVIVDESIETDDPQKLREYHREQLKKGLEGVVVKQVQSVYEPGRRGFSWVKFKEVETATGKLSDTVDAVVMGFYRGRGKRTKFGIGAFLVGIRDQNVIKTLAKIGTGLTDDQWREMRQRLEQVVALNQPATYQVHKNLAPDVWVDPTVVVEIAADEITKSPIHAAGWALRFPRLVRFRDDKSLMQSTSLKELLKIKQAS